MTLEQLVNNYNFNTICAAKLQKYNSNLQILGNQGPLAKITFQNLTRKRKRLDEKQTST